MKKSATIVSIHKPRKGTIKMNLKLFQALSDAFGPSGYEEDVLRCAEPYLAGLRYRNDAMNNLYLDLPAQGI